jgi:hypothetical protein
MAIAICDDCAKKLKNYNLINKEYRFTGHSTCVGCLEISINAYAIPTLDYDYYKIPKDKNNIEAIKRYLQEIKDGVGNAQPNIDFIKWMCEKAGWVWKENCGIEIGETRGTYFSIKTRHCEQYIYPLLLQRAIEGVNAKDEEFPYFVMYDDEIDVHCLISKKNKSFQYSKASIDTAKEAALEYIWKQEAGV